MAAPSACHSVNTAEGLIRTTAMTPENTYKLCRITKCVCMSVHFFNTLCRAIYSRDAWVIGQWVG